MSSRIVEPIGRKAMERRPRIAIGAGSQKGYVEKIFAAAGAVDFADVEVVGPDNVEKELIGLLKAERVDAAVRGSCIASKVLKEIIHQFRPNRIGRIALLETSSGREFFFAPVGVDEGNTVEEKVFLIEEGFKLAERFGIRLDVGGLSGGRKSDVGRHKNVEKRIKEAEKIVGLVKKTGRHSIKNYNILVEDAISEGANFIIAPNGITGNLMYRTLAFLGGGRGYGAPMA